MKKTRCERITWQLDEKQLKQMFADHFLVPVDQLEFIWKVTGIYSVSGVIVTQEIPIDD